MLCLIVLWFLPLAKHSQVLISLGPATPAHAAPASAPSAILTLLLFVVMNSATDSYLISSLIYVVIVQL